MSEESAGVPGDAGNDRHPDAEPPTADVDRARAPLPPISDRALIMLLAAITASGPVALNIYLPALPLIQADFDVSLSQAQSTLSIALLAFAAGILVHGPLSDRYGRRPIILCGLAVYLVGTALCLAAPTIGTLMAARAVQSLGAAAGVIVPRAIVGDLYPRERMARMLAYLTMTMVLGPTIAPIVGAWISVHSNWRGIFAFLLIAGTAILGLAWRWLPETRPASTTSASASAIAYASTVLLRKPAFSGYVLQSAIIYATFLVFVSLAPYVMVDALHRPPTEYGVYFLLLMLGYFIGNWTVTRLSSTQGVERLMVQGVAVACLACLTALALVGAGFAHPLAIFLPIGVMAFGQGMALPNVFASAVALAPENTGVASSLLGFLQQLVGASCIQAMSLVATDSAVPMLLFCTAAGIVAWVGIVVQVRIGGSGQRQTVRPSP